MPKHEIVQCSCGAIIAECACAMPNKPIRVVPLGCRNCLKSGDPEHEYPSSAEVVVAFSEWKAQSRA